jgi:hypothetical protein
MTRASGAAAEGKREKGAGGGESRGAAVGLPVAEQGERRREAGRSGAAGAERSTAERSGSERGVRGGAEQRAEGSGSFGSRREEEEGEN